MICSKCGEKLPQDSKFCHYCGSPATMENRKAPPVPAEFTQSKDKKPIIAVFIVLAVLISASIGYALISENDSTPEPTTSNNYYHEPDVEAPNPSTKNPNDKISYDVKSITITANSSGGVGDVYSQLIEHDDYRIYDSQIGQIFEVNYKVVGGIGLTHMELDGNTLKPVYGAIEDCWYNVTLPDGTVGFVWGGTNAMYVDERK